MEKSKKANDSPKYLKNELILSQPIEKSQERIIDRLDLQILIAVFLMFISSWVYLKDIICNFTISTPITTQYVFIIAHYVQTIYIIFCLYISYIKGQYIFNKESDINEGTIIYFNLFMKTWAPILGILFCMIITYNMSYVPWLFMLMGIVLLIWYFSVVIHRYEVIAVLVLLICFFPLFVSLMTVTIRPITLTTHKEFYTIEDQVVIFVHGKGYACDYYPINLDDNFLKEGTEYIIKDNTITVPASSIKNGNVSIGVSGPITSLKSFLLYPYCKLINRYDSDTFKTPSQSNHFVNININIQY